MPARLARFGANRIKASVIRRIDDRPDHDLVGDALRQKGGRLDEGAGERERGIIGQRGDEGGQDERRRPAPALGRDIGRAAAVGNLRQPQVRKHRRVKQAIEHPDQQRDEADQGDQRADLLAEPDLIVRGTRRAAR